MTGLGPGNAAAQSAAEVRARIERHGCDRAQYAASPGCRALYERLRAAEARRGRRPRASSPGIFGFLFGSSRARSRRPAPERRAPYGADNRPYGYDSARSGYGSYRTLCVRMCDGYYFPISFSAGRGQFGRDARQCESRCEAPARLFVHRTPGGSVERMVDLQGRPYSAIPNAFRYREEYVEECRCKPEPWSEEAQAQYAARADGSNDAETRIAGEDGAGQAGDRDAAMAHRRPRPDPGVARRDIRPREQPAYSAGDVRPDGRWWAGSW